jgi:hypothetical protein
MPSGNFQEGGKVVRGQCVVTTVNLAREARAILDAVAPARCKGDFLSRLLFEYAARSDERARLRRELAMVGCEHLAAEHAAT